MAKKPWEIIFEQARKAEQSYQRASGEKPSTQRLSTYLDRASYDRMLANGFSEDDILSLTEFGIQKFGSDFRFGSTYSFDLTPYQQNPTWFLDYADDDEFGYNLDYNTEKGRYKRGELPSKLEDLYDETDPDDMERLANGLPPKQFQIKQNAIISVLNDVAAGKIKKFDWKALGYEYNSDDPLDVGRRETGLMPYAAEQEYAGDYVDKLRKRFGLEPTKITNAGIVTTNTTAGSASNAANITEKPTEKKAGLFDVIGEFFSGIGGGDTGDRVSVVGGIPMTESAAN